MNINCISTTQSDSPSSKIQKPTTNLENEEEQIMGNLNTRLPDPNSKAQKSETSEKKPLSRRSSQRLSKRLSQRFGQEEGYDEYGFRLAPPLMKQSEELVDPEIETQRKILWWDIIGNWKDWKDSKYDQVIKQVIKGIPDPVRGQAWKALSQSHALSKKYPADYYQTLIKGDDSTSACRQIVLDLPRTLANHKYFSEDEGRDKMYNILKAYSKHNPEIGYCQGMSYVAATILLYYVDVEEAFWMFTWMIDNHFATQYTRHMTGLIKQGKVLNLMFEKLLPEFYAHLKKYEVDVVLFATPWFMCLFTGLTYWPTVLRIWDLFFVEGIMAIFRVSLAILMQCQDDLLQLHGMEHIMPYLLKISPSKLQPDDLIESSYKFDIPGEYKLALETLDKQEQYEMLHLLENKSPIKNNSSNKRKATEEAEGQSLKKKPILRKNLDLNAQPSSPSSPFRRIRISSKESIDLPKCEENDKENVLNQSTSSFCQEKFLALNAKEFHFSTSPSKFHVKRSHPQQKKKTKLNVTRVPKKFELKSFTNPEDEDQPCVSPSKATSMPASELFFLRE